jgi:hypothetical protein
MLPRNLLHEAAQRHDAEEASAKRPLGEDERASGPMDTI